VEQQPNTGKKSDGAQGVPKMEDHWRESYVAEIAQSIRTKVLAGF
jgi:hypothetical protein